MSMPNIPDVKISREQSLNTILASIGMEELSLAHLMNAEGEKIQMALGTLPGCHKPFEPCEILKINENARRMIRDLMMTEILLTMKLENVVELCNCREHDSPRDCDRECEGKCHDE